MFYDNSRTVLFVLQQTQEQILHIEMIRQKKQTWPQV